MYVIIKFDNKGGDAMCTYVLMHKNIPVLTAILDDTLRGCNRMRFYRILVAVPLKYKKYQEI